MPENGNANTVLSRSKRFWLVFKVIELRLRFIAIMAATGLTFAYWDTIWNYYDKWNRPAGEHVAALSEFEYYCPMHPSVIRDEAANCPICGMPLSKRKIGQKTELPEGVTARVQLSPQRVVQAGLRTAEVDYEPLAETITTVGFVTFDERRLARISSRTKGLARVEKLHVNFTGVEVRAGQPLAELYSPELYQATQELLLAKKRAEEVAQGRSSAARSLIGEPNELVRIGREKLMLWGLTAPQIDAILARGQADYRVPILAPTGGVVLRKNVVVGQYVNEGESMFEVADLSHVWVQAQVYEDQLALVHVGQTVEARVEAFPGEAFPGTVAFLDPALNPATRTIGVRYDLDNADGRLRPGMYATVTLKTPVSESPAFRSRLAKAEAGPEPDAKRQVRLTAAQQKICPVTNAKLGSMGEPIAVDVHDHTVWTCCAACPPKLQAAPDRYLARLAPPPKDRVLAVPESAVIDTGDHKIVYVETEPGVYEGRAVILGPRIGARFPVLDGLLPGEKVAAAGAFLVDAESRLSGSHPEFLAPASQPAAAHVH